jgi:hypothetical protein
MFDEVSAVLRLFPPTAARPKPIEELGGTGTILPANLVGLIHADGEMDNFHVGAVDLNDSLSER